MKVTAMVAAAGLVGTAVYLRGPSTGHAVMFDVDTATDITAAGTTATAAASAVPKQPKTAEPKNLPAHPPAATSLYGGGVKGIDITELSPDEAAEVLATEPVKPVEDNRKSSRSRRRPGPPPRPRPHPAAAAVTPPPRKKARPRALGRKAARATAT